MNQYSNADKGFYKTSLLLAEMFSSKDLISRSEARRLGVVIERFDDIVLDFNDINSIRQAFTHELFVVFKNKHLEMNLEIINANEEVLNTIKRVKNTAAQQNAGIFTF